MTAAWERYEREARRALPRAVYDYFAGGSGQERTLADNLAAWGRLRLRPRVLRDVARVRTATTLLGTDAPVPLLVAPVAYQRLAHPEGEAATAAGAAAAGWPLVVSTRASLAVEEVAAAAPGAVHWFQVYVLRDRDWTAELVRRAAAAGCSALVLTGDTPRVGRKHRAGGSPRGRAGDVPAGARMGNAPTWLAPGDDPEALPGALQDPAADLGAIAWLRELSGLPVLVKGVLRGDEAARCVAAGAAGVIVSNHGGRQLDTAVASADALAEVVAAVAGRAEVYVDGGVRRGTDVVKALALGARGVLVGRPVVWGLAAGGAGGVRAVLDELRDDLEHAMALCGAATIDELTSDLVRHPTVCQHWTHEHDDGTGP